MLSNYRTQYFIAIYLSKVQGYFAFRQPKMDSSYYLPPFPLSYYAHHRHFDSYYRKEHRFFKQTQNWDLFHAWGQERLLVS